MITRCKIWLFFVLFFPLQILAQEKMSDSLISINLQNTTIRHLLDSVSAQKGFLFSYDSELLNDTTKVNIDADSATIEEIIKLVTHGKPVDLVRKKRHIIIKEATKSEFQSIEGSVKHRNQPLIAASVYLKNSFRGVITNDDGEFVLKVPDHSLNDTLVVSHLGYNPKFIPLQSIEKGQVEIRLQAHSVILEEVIVSGASARTIIKTMLENLEAHYPSSDVTYTSFYREEVKRGSNYQYFSEAVLKVYKNSYQGLVNMERIQRLQSRTIKSASKKDSVLLKIKSGLRTSLYLDVVRNRPTFIHPQTIEQYRYKLDGTSYIDGDMIYLIRFEPKPGANVRYEGTLYVNAQYYALEGVDFAYASTRKDALEELVSKRSRGVKKKFNQASYKIRYKQIGSTWYLQRTETTLSVKVKKKNNWFYKPYTSQTLFLVLNTDTTNMSRPRRKESVNPSVIFSDEVFKYTPDFWGKYDYFKPSDQVIRDLKKMQEVERTVSRRN